jgi:hypothetical protein
MSAARKAQRETLQAYITAQLGWIKARGGTLHGYQAYYGKRSGKRFYKADQAQLERFEAKLREFDGPQLEG